MSEDDGPAERKRRFTVPSDDSDIPLVKPLFRSMAGSASSARGGAVVAASSAGSYADYVFKQAATVKVPHHPAGERPETASASVSTGGPMQASDRTSGPVPALPNTSAFEAVKPVAQPPSDAVGPAALENTAQAEGMSGEGKAQVPAKAIGKGSCLVVSPRQRGNPILKFVRNVPWEFDEIVPDYVMGPTTCALFLSLRYHNLNPNYIHERLKVLGQSFALRVLLVQVDVKDPHYALKELAKICILADCTLILAWSAEEAGRYLETYKSYEQKPADVLKEKVDQDFMSKITDCLTTVKSVNKTDCTTLLSTFGSYQIRQMEDVKISKKSKVGILPFVSGFEEFAELAESIFRNAERRGDLDKAYTKLINAVFFNVEKVANESQKTPRDVVMLENFHHLLATLSRLKIPCLEAEKREAKQKYGVHLQSYVIYSLGQPLEKLNHFFEGVETRVAQGVREDEVSYQLAFNKQELRKVIKEYPGKEVKKGLDSLYKKVNKHLCDEENLLQVVWHSMQDEFIRQYKHFEGLINRCYKGSGITMEFSIEDILEYFSSIAQSH